MKIHEEEVIAYNGFDRFELDGQVFLLNRHL